MAELGGGVQHRQTVRDPPDHWLRQPATGAPADGAKQSALKYTRISVVVTSRSGPCERWRPA
jgi:hypothetical protein